MQSHHQTFTRAKQSLLQKDDFNSETAKDFIDTLSHKDSPEESLVELTKLWIEKGFSSSDLVCLSQEVLSRIPNPKLSINYDLHDCCGTGGDSSGSFNFSTASAFLAASLGKKIAKHGGRKTSSRSGSIDFLEALGILPVLISSSDSKNVIEKHLDKHGLIFISSPATHQLLGRWKQICGRENFLGLTGLIGTLTNPLKPAHQVLGVAKPEWGALMLTALKTIGRQSAIVMCGESKSANRSPVHYLDEASVCGKTHFWIFNNQMEVSFCLEPEEIGFAGNYSLADLAGSTPDVNSQIFINLLDRNSLMKSSLTKDFNLPAIKDALVFNTALILCLDQPIQSKAEFKHILQEQIKKVLLALDDGITWNYYESYASSFAQNK